MPKKKNDLILQTGNITHSDETLILDTGIYSDTQHIKQSKREWRGDIKKDFFNRTISPVFPTRIEYIAWVIDGGKGSGKTTTADSIYESILKDVTISEIIFTPNHPESAEVNLIPVRSIKQVFSLLDSRPYQVLLIDDASRYNKTLLNEVLQDFNELRHIYGKLTGEGVIILLLMVQDLFQLGKVLRKDTSGTIFKECPQDESDQHYIDRQTCYRGIDLLSVWTSKVKDDKILSFLSRAVVSTESWTGYMNINMSDDPRFRPYQEHANPVGIKINEPELEEDSISFDFKSGDYSFTEINRFKDLDLIIDGLKNWSEIKTKIKLKTKKLRQKHIEAYIMHLKGSTLSHTAEEFGVSDTLLTNDYDNHGWFAIIRREFIGHMLEYLLVQDEQYYSGYTRIAGNTRVDLESPDKQTVIEVKCRHKNETLNKKMLSTEMIKLLETAEKECQLCFCLVRKKTALFKIYSITKTTKTTKEEKQL